MPTYRVLQLIASTNSVFVLDNHRHTVDVNFLDKVEANAILQQLSADGLPAGAGLSLHFERIRSQDALPAMDIYLNLEKESKLDDRNYIGSMGLYGIVESSVDGPGQDRHFDVGQVFTEVYHQSNWSKRRFHLTLMPDRPLGPEVRVSIERIALEYYEV